MALGSYRLAPVLTLALLVTGPAPAAVNLTDYLRPPALSAPVVSPDGRFVAVGVATNGRVNLGVIDLAERKPVPLTSFTDYDVVSYSWVGNDRLVFSLGQYNTPTGPGGDGGGLFMISRDGRENQVLSQTAQRANRFVYRGLEMVRAVPGSDREIIAGARERSQETLDLYRVDITNGRKQLLTESTPGRVIEWILDRELRPRVAVSLAEKEPVYIVHYRGASGDGPWRELWRSDMARGPMSMPLGFMPDGKRLLVASNEGRDTMGLFTHDPEANKRLEALAAHPQFDMGADQIGTAQPGLIIDPVSQEIAGLRVAAEKLETVWVEPKLAALQKAIDNALPDRINRFAPPREGQRVLINSFSDREPARWYLLDRATMRLEELGRSRPWLGPDKLVEMKPFTYRTRDGLDIPGYIFLPRDHKPGTKLPTVVHIHGGPWARADTWGYGTFGSLEGQILAAHGYAVVVPNFRITPGLGSKVFYSGRRQFGLRMQEDIEDVTDWAVKEGFADPARVCLSGASYGGYATLMGLAKTPDKYRCGVAGLAVTDLELLMTSGSGDIPTSPVGLALWKSMAGDPATDREALRAVSPALLAGRIKAPVLMYSGGADIRVPIEQPRKMRSALVDQGRPPVWIEEPAEGHGFGVLSANVSLYERMLAFLDQHLRRAP